LFFSIEAIYVVSSCTDLFYYSHAERLRSEDGGVCSNQFWITWNYGSKVELRTTCITPARGVTVNFERGK